MESRIEALRRAAAALTAAGVADARVDARILLCAAAGIDRATLVRDPDQTLAVETGRGFDAFLARRVAREPVSRILGHREFWGLDFAVTPAVLDPRPDTETLVAAALECAVEPAPSRRVLDLGTGSGAILCALLSELPVAVGVAVDRSFAACRVARHNLGHLGFGARSMVVQGSWGSAFAQTFDLVVSNPPYIETTTIATLHPEVRDYDPTLALDGGSDGLTAYRAILAELPRLLAPDGSALLEVGAGQAGPVVNLAASHGFICRAIRRDLAGIERVVILGRV